MKKTRLFALLLAVLLLGSALTSCGLFERLFGTGKDLYTLIRINEMLEAAAPKKATADISAVYTDPAVTLTADLTLEATDTAEKYSYRIDYLLPIDEALASGQAIGEHRGYLTIEGDTITEDSGEVDEVIIEAISLLSLSAPTLEVAYLESHEIIEENGKIILKANVRNAFLSVVFGLDFLVDGAQNVALVIVIDAATERPTSTTLTFTSRKGAAVTAKIDYAY